MIKKYPVIYEGKDYTVTFDSETLYECKIEVKIYRGVKHWFSCPVYSNWVNTYVRELKTEEGFKGDIVFNRDLSMKEIIEEIFRLWERDKNYKLETIIKNNKREVEMKRRIKELEEWDGVIK